MKRKIDTWRGRLIYRMRLGIVEPVFGNLSIVITSAYYAVYRSCAASNIIPRGVVRAAGVSGLRAL